MEITIKPIGFVKKDEKGMYIELAEEFKIGLKNIEGFQYLNILWWAHLYANDETRRIKTCKKPYTNCPEEIGIFATRSQVRPNPICMSAMPVQSIDHEKGIIRTYYVDCEEGTPVLDIKPYYPCSDKIRNAATPDWCKHWPQFYEDSGSFDWGAEFNF
jgi:tRNA-Thr(GGU) m(6)t(6)A37 methyltransferase TsaA